MIFQVTLINSYDKLMLLLVNNYYYLMEQLNVIYGVFTIGILCAKFLYVSLQVIPIMSLKMTCFYYFNLSVEV